MQKIDLFLRLTQANLKRLKSYIVSIIAAVVILLFVCSIAGSIVSKEIYKENSFSTIKLAFYLPDDDDSQYNQMALGIIENVDSVKSTVELIQVKNIDEGYHLLEHGDATYFIIVPENFSSGILNGTNTPLDIIMKDSSTLSSYITNELFLVYASYLGIAQSGVYSALDTARLHDFSAEKIKQVQNDVNLIYMERALDKDRYIETIEYTDVGGYNLIEHYIASAIMISLFLLAFILLPLLQDYGSAIYIRLNASGISNFHIFISNFIVTLAALYIAYLPCLLGVIILNKSFDPISLIVIFPALIIIALIINVVSFLTKQSFAGNMSILVLTLLLAYIGGGILPHTMLPEVIQDISVYFPGEHILKCISYALFK